MSEVSEFPIPETHVLAVASHVVYGYVGNTMATFVMQSLGCEVSSINTVQLRYGQAKGTRATASEISDLYQGLRDSYLDSFDMMLSGYLPGAAAVEAVAFFWVLDPVMGDNGKLYVAEDVVPAYKALIKDADLILPNQFEAETLSGVKIVDMDSLKLAISTLHETYHVPHIMITSITLPTPGATASLAVVGSTATTNSEPRMFSIRIPAIDCFFSGTGDMFAALLLVRFREAVFNTPGLSETDAWRSDNDVKATELPLAQAAEKVLASMHAVLTKTKESRDLELELYKKKRATGTDTPDGKKMKLVTSKATEVRLVRNLGSLKNPNVQFRAEDV
ncbi:Ribokinase-like protein [Glarea lozoyensis ATCC 20868]|uniref:pyridoxal kinase n=1 Tax=Glarea lozoyensis (strain ATCC 20868 / MF5171) TaxID=1116229 RepID=S3DRU6_GLAL2|nr:Ribokinase-like protein [Glarea lozoyensis ATCC 20868]EPE29173.1 Ribokinase-like protein [Glarea lozoyensis ATCC 20868]